MSKNLHELIHSLNANEKRYFQLESRLVTRSSLPNYLLIYQALLAQKSYDREAIFQKIKKEGFHGDFPSEIKYLKERIFKSLRSYRQSTKGLGAVFNLVVDSDILAEHGLKLLARRQLNKALKVAEKEGFFLFAPIVKERIALLNLPTDLNPKSPQVSLEVAHSEMKVLRTQERVRQQKIQNILPESALEREEIATHPAPQEKQLHTNAIHLEILEHRLDYQLFFSRSQLPSALKSSQKALRMFYNIPPPLSHRVIMELGECIQEYLNLCPLILPNTKISLPQQLSKALTPQDEFLKKVVDTRVGMRKQMMSGTQGSMHFPALKKFYFKCKEALPNPEKAYLLYEYFFSPNTTMPCGH